MKSLIFKPKNFYVVQGNYGYGWDDLTYENTKEEVESFKQELINEKCVGPKKIWIKETKKSEAIRSSL